MTLSPGQLRRLLPALGMAGVDGLRFAEALEAWLDGDAATLDEALGLAPGWRQRDRRDRRDALLRALAAHYDGKRRTRATAMAADLARYRAVAWRLERGLANLPAASAKRQLMHAAFRLDPETPTGWRQLFDIIGEGDLCNGEGVAVAQPSGEPDHDNSVHGEAA